MGRWDLERMLAVRTYSDSCFERGVFFFFFFFFQAEDGIRDLTVTGVQTCALPILKAAGWYSGSDHVHMNYGGNLRNTPENLMFMAEAEDLDVVGEKVANKDNRSEERRVGKECRARWSRYQKKKKSKRNDDESTAER